MLKYDVTIPMENKWKNDGHYINDLREFLSQEQYDVAECVILPDTTYKSAYNSYYNAKKRAKLPVKIVRRRGRLFLKKAK